MTVCLCMLCMFIYQKRLSQCLHSVLCAEKKQHNEPLATRHDRVPYTIHLLVRFRNEKTKTVWKHLLMIVMLTLPLFHSFYWIRYYYLYIQMPLNGIFLRWTDISFLLNWNVSIGKDGQARVDTYTKYFTAVVVYIFCRFSFIHSSNICCFMNKMVWDMLAAHWQYIFTSQTTQTTQA